MPLSLDEFWNLAQRSMIFDAPELTKLRRQFDEEVGAHQPCDGRAAAKWLVRRQRLTVYQAETLVRGQPGPFQFGEYRILRPRLVPGDSASRWNAIHVGTGHRVLVHLWPEADLDHWPSAERQADAARRIRHPNLDRVYTTLVAADCRMAVSEWPEGRPLAAVLQARRRLPVPQACWLVQQLAAGLAHLHALGSVHGRLSAEEVIMQPGGHVKLLRAPWGIAGIAASDPLRPPPVAACHLRAPEFLQSGTMPDALTDIYALGCLFYQVIAGRVPFEGASAEQIMAGHATQRIEPLESFAPVPEGLTELISFMMAKRREVRTSDLTDVIDKLHAFVPHGARQTVPRAWATESYYLAHLQQGSSNAASAVEPASPGPPVVDEDDEALVIVDRDRPLVITAEHNRMGNSVGTRPRGARSAYRAWLWPVLSLCASAGALTLWAAFASRERGRTRPDPVQAAADLPADRASDGRIARVGRREHSATSTAVTLVPDDGQTLWASPTSGPPIELTYAPPDSQMFIHIRPAALIAAPEGPKILEALGPEFARLRNRLEAEWGLEWDTIERLFVAFQPRDSGPPQAIFRLHVTPEVRRRLLAASDVLRRGAAGEIAIKGSAAVLFPPSSDATIVIAPLAWIERLEDVGTPPPPPPLRRQLEMLRSTSDADQHVWVLAAPNFLSADGRALWAGPYAALRQPLVDWLGEGTSAASLSVHAADGTFVELRLIGSADEHPSTIAAQRRLRLRQVPDEVTLYLEQIPLDRYWQPLAIRFPRMLQFAADQVRIGADGSAAVLNAVLPPEAAHNLILASELALANGQAARPSADVRTGPGMDELLAESVVLRVDQQSLDRVVQDLAESVRTQTGHPSFTIEIVGADLELEGITRNQQIRQLDLPPGPLRTALTELVRRANPIEVADPRQETQRLVWVVAPDRGATILLTTRSAALEKRYTLPQEFLAGSVPAGLQ